MKDEKCFLKNSTIVKDFIDFILKFNYKSDKQFEIILSVKTTMGAKE